MNAYVVRGDATRLPFADESVDLVITSPPYFSMRRYQDDGDAYGGQIGNEATPQDFLDALWTVTAECIRVLKPTGSIFVNLGDKYAGSGGHNNAALDAPGNMHKRAYKGFEQRDAPMHYNRNNEFATGTVRNKSLMGLPWRYAIGCMDQLGLILRSEIIWHKQNCLPESVKDRVRRNHEQFFHFTKEPRYYSAIDEVRDPYKDGALERLAYSYQSPDAATAGYNAPNNKDIEPNPLGSLPPSVWTLPMDPLRVPAHLGVDHFAAFPQELVRRIVLGWSPPAICGTCNKGRWPVVDRTVDLGPPFDRKRFTRSDANAPGQGWSGPGVVYPKAKERASILGYACDCTPYVDHPAVRKTGASHRDGIENGDYTSKEFGDYGHRPKSGAHREYTLQGWEPPESVPAVVLDPFGGTGTVAMVARILGRTGLSVDLSQDYCKLSKWRIFDSKHAHKSLAKTQKDRQRELF